MLNQFRQGDVLIEASEIPADAAPVDLKGRPAVLAEGEATGHAHTVEDIELFERDGTLYLRVPEGGAAVKHQEHAPVQLPPGTFRVQRQREYSPEAIRNVAD